jgi:hypothetical protein
LDGVENITSCQYADPRQRVVVQDAGWMASARIQNVFRRQLDSTVPGVLRMGPERGLQQVSIESSVNPVNLVVLTPEGLGGKTPVRLLKPD